MCGIAGIFQHKPAWDGDKFQSALDKMTDSLQHRGPDSRGTWLNIEQGVGLGHRRLSIRDLSNTGQQPMISSCGRFVITYNGEIYSHEEISVELGKLGRRFRGSSDTEIILEACAEFGVEPALKKMIGMFAFAIYDRQKQELSLARDRLGIKPLYWGIVQGRLMFASELKALRTDDEWQPVLDRNALSSFMRHNYIPAPHTIYSGIYKLEPGCMLTVTREGQPHIKRYWDLKEFAYRDTVSASSVNETDMLEELDGLLSDAVARRMVSDVPIGTLLSGGIDSSLVTALMAEQSQGQIHTFTIGFSDSDFNEAPYAREIAAYLGTRHTELYAEPGHALDLIEKIPYWYDEPFADSSQLPTLLVSELTRRHVTVVLSGDGGDELFAGYNRYNLGLELWQKTRLAPAFLRNLLATGLLQLPADRINRISTYIPGSLSGPQLGNKLHKFAQAIQQSDPDKMYLRMLSHWTEPDNIVSGASEYKGILWDSSVNKALPDFLSRMQFLDTLTYLPDDILTKVDRASMSVGLEARVPLLDHRVVEMAWRFPVGMKIRNGKSKWPLRKILYKRVPERLIERPKMGFGVPFDQWIRGPIREWAETLLDETRLAEQGLFNVVPIREKWCAHLNGENWGYPLWNVLMAQAWIDQNQDVRL